MAWENQPMMRLELFGNCESSLNDKIREFTGIGFQKVLSVSEREVLTKSSLNLLLPSPCDVIGFDSNKLRSHNHL
jgi:hypothetical protein